MFGVLGMAACILDYRRAEVRPPRNHKRGYTVVELMVTIVIVSVLAATVGALFVKLLTIQEQEREEAYIREKLSDICGAYADFLSVGSSISTSNRTTLVTYRHETGGVSLETGIVSRVAQLTSSTNATSKAIDLNVDVFESGGLVRKFSRSMSGDAPLIPLMGDMVECTIVTSRTYAALGYLQVTAKYKVENDEGTVVEKPVTVGRMIRLWNRE